MKNEIRFIVERSSSQVARRPKPQRDGTMHVYVTRQHYRVFMYTAGMIRVRQVPTYQEIADACGYANRDSAYRAIRALGEHGLLTTDVVKARSIQLTDQGKAVYRQWKAVQRRARAK